MAPRVFVCLFSVVFVMTSCGLRAKAENQFTGLQGTDEKLQSLISRAPLLSEIKEFWFSEDKIVKIGKCLQNVDSALSEPRILAKNLLRSNCAGNWSECCDCQTLCKILPDCCFENIVDNLGNIPQDEKLKKLNSMKCVSMSTKTSFWLITRCPDAWIESDIRTKCESPDVSEPLEILPIHTGGLFSDYRNMYCAQCHGVDEYAFWRLAVDCSSLVSPHRFRSFSDFLQYIQLEPTCKLNPIVPPSYCAKRCYSPELTKCYQQEFTMEQIEECEDFKPMNESSAIILHLAIDEFGYRLTKCNERNIPTTISLHALLNINPRKDLVVDEGVEACPADMTYDTNLETCRKLKCPLGKIPHRGECIRYFQESVETQQTFSIEVYMYHYGARKPLMEDFSSLCANFNEKVIFSEITTYKIDFWHCWVDPNSIRFATDSCTLYIIPTDQMDSGYNVTYLKFVTFMALSGFPDLAHTYAFVERIDDLEFEYVFSDNTTVKRIAKTKVDQRCNWTDSGPLEESMGDMSAPVTYLGQLLMICSLCFAILNMMN